MLPTGISLVSKLVIHNISQIPVEQQLHATKKPAELDALGDELKAQEHVIILETLNMCQGSRKRVAEKLGVSARTLRYKMAKMRDMGIEIPA